MSYQIVYVTKDKKKVYCHYYANHPACIYIKLNGIKIETPIISQKEHIFVNKPFITEFSFEIQISKDTDNICIQIDSKKTYIDSLGEKSINEISIKQIKILTASLLKKSIHNLIRKLLLG